jgi:hypothetical protein
MYKHAYGKRVVVGGTRPATGSYKPKTKLEIRRWWYPVIEQANKTQTKLSRHTSHRPPNWLAEEFRRLDWVKWLEAVDRGTGQFKMKDK